MITISKHITKILLGLLVVAALLLVFAAPAHAASNWTAWYWNNTSLDGSPALQRSESNTPNYNWGAGSPAPGVIQEDYFSARWSSNQNLEAGRYRFTVKSDDGARLWVNGHLIIDEWHDATNIAYTAEYDVTTNGAVPIVLEYYENIGDAQIHLAWEWIGNVASTGPTKAEYFNNMNLEGQPALVRYENEIYYWWGTGSPAPGIINNDHFSARYTRSMNLNAGRYRFTMAADDGMRMWVDGRLVFDEWNDSNATPFVMEMDLTSGVHSFVVSYYENVGNAGIAVMGENVGTSGGGGSSGETATVDTSYLNLRSGPGTQYEVIDVLSRGTVVELTGNQVDYWVEVITPTGQVGWVSNGYLKY